MSSRPCVGCSWAPSPALMTLQLQMLRQQVRRPGHGVAHDHDVDAHRLDVLGRVDERLALADAGAAGGEIDGVGAEAPGGQAEAGARARGRLEEQVDDDLALEIGAFPLSRLTSTKSSAVSRMVTISSRLRSSRPSR